VPFPKKLMGLKGELPGKHGYEPIGLSDLQNLCSMWQQKVLLPNWFHLGMDGRELLSPSGFSSVLGKKTAPT